MQPLTSSTIELYTAAWQDFAAFCAQRNRSALPAATATVAWYLSSLADAGIGTVALSGRLSAINAAHTRNGYTRPLDDGAIADTMERLRDSYPARSARQPATISSDTLRRCLAALPPAPRLAVRDAALLMLAYGGILRPSEARLLTLRQIGFPHNANEIRVFLPLGKRRQEVIVIPAAEQGPCVVRAVRTLRGYMTGFRRDAPLFQSLTEAGRWRGKPITSSTFTAIKAGYIERAALPADAFRPHRSAVSLVDAERLPPLFPFRVYEAPI